MNKHFKPIKIKMQKVLSNKYFKRQMNILFICLGIVILLIFLIWMLLIICGNIPSGFGLKNSDWLQFLGSFLGFVGTTFLGIVSLVQTRTLHKEELKSKNKTMVTIKNTNLDINFINSLMELSAFDIHRNTLKMGYTIDFSVYFNLISPNLPEAYKIDGIDIFPSNDINLFNFIRSNTPYRLLKYDQDRTFHINIQIGIDDKDVKIIAKCIKTTPIPVSFVLNLRSNNIVTVIYCTIILDEIKKIDEIKYSAKVITCTSISQDCYIDKNVQMPYL